MKVVVVVVLIIVVFLGGGVRVEHHPVELNQLM